MKKLLAALLATFAIGAQANTITTGNIDIAAGDVDYYAFDYAGVFSGNVTAYTGSFFNNPDICVFSASVSLSNLLGCNADSGIGSNASFSFSTPAWSLGTYIVAVSSATLTAAEAVAGSNPGSSAITTRLYASSILSPLVANFREVNPVPLPGTLALLGAGLLGLGLSRRRKQA